MIGRYVRSGPAIVPTLLTASGTETDARDYSTASVSPTAGNLVLAAIFPWDAGGALTEPTCSGCGLTWTLVATGPGAGFTNLYVFRAYADPALVTAGAITFTSVCSAGQTCDGAVWCVVEVDNVGVAVNDGIVQTGTANAAADSVSVTLGAFANSLNGTAAFVTAYDNAGGAIDITEGTGFTMLTGSEVSQAAGGDTLRIGFEYRTDNDTSVDATASTDNDRMFMVAFEIARA